MILLVEDNPAIAALYAEAIGNAGYPVDVAMTGREALDRLGARPYRLALVDLSLPDMTGADVAIAAHASGLDLPMVAVSGAAVLIDPAKLAAAGFTGAPVEKPLRLSALVDLVRQLAGEP